MVGNATIGDALTEHYATYDLPPDGGEHATWFRVHVGPLSIPLPNPPARRRAVFFHDVNHIVTGYDTTFSDGEMSIAAFEVSVGCGRYAIAWYINLAMFAIGLAIAPKTTFAGFMRGRSASSIYRRADDRAALSAMPVGELRSELGLDNPPRLPGAADYVTFAAWAAAGVVVALAPWAAVIAAAWAVRHVAHG